MPYINCILLANGEHCKGLAGYIPIIPSGHVRSAFFAFCFVIVALLLHFLGHLVALFCIFSRFVFRVCCERPCEQLPIPKLRFVRSSLRPRSAVIQVLCEQLPVPLLRCSGALRATSRTVTAIFRCFASVPVGPYPDVLCRFCTITAICRSSLRPNSAVTTRCLRRPCWAVPQCSLNFVHALAFSSKNRRALYYSHTGTRY